MPSIAKKKHRQGDKQDVSKKELCKKKGGALLIKKTDNGWRVRLRESDPEKRFLPQDLSEAEVLG